MINLLVIITLLIFFLIIKYILYNDNNNTKWNLTESENKIILYSTDYKYLIILNKQNNNSGCLEINIKYRNDSSEIRITDYNCDILRIDNIFKKDNYLILNNIDSLRFNIISYKDFPEIYEFQKKELNPYYHNPNLGFYGTRLLLNKIESNKIKLTTNIINKFVTKNTYFIPEYMILY
jgi:hypothetical protein